MAIIGLFMIANPVHFGKNGQYFKKGFYSTWDDYISDLNYKYYFILISRKFFLLSRIFWTEIVIFRFFWHFWEAQRSVPVGCTYLLPLPTPRTDNNISKSGSNTLISYLEEAEKNIIWLIMVKIWPKTPILKDISLISTIMDIWWIFKFTYKSLRMSPESDIPTKIKLKMCSLPWEKTYSLIPHLWCQNWSRKIFTISILSHIYERQGKNGTNKIFILQNVIHP